MSSRQSPPSDRLSPGPAGGPPAGPRLAHALLALAACVAIAGCAAHRPPAPAAPPAAPVAATGATIPAAPAAEPLPAVELTSPLLFEIIAAEVAAQRGDPGAAFATLMKAAQDTGDPRLARRAAEIAVGARAGAQALEAAALWHRLAPDDPEAEQTYTALLVTNGRYDDARPLIERQLASADEPLVLLGRLEHMLARAPEPARALSLIEQLATPYLAQPRRAFDAHMILARAAHQFGDDRRAAAEARAALALRPDAEAAAVAAAQLIAEARDGGANAAQSTAARTEAIALLAGFLERNPDAHQSRLAYARLLVADGRLDGARKQFELVLIRDEGNADPLFALGVLSFEAGQLSEARGYFERYLAAIDAGADRDPDPVYLNLARIAEEERRYDDSLALLARVKGEGSAADALERRAIVLGKLNRVDEALGLLVPDAQAGGDERARRVLVEAQILREAHRPQEALDRLEKMLKERPDDANLLYESAMTAERLDRIDLMETQLRHLMRLQPDYAHAYNALGYTFADRNIRLQEAYQLIDKALHLAPEDGFILDSMGWVQDRLGNLSAAYGYLARAYQLKPEADVAAHLGEVEWSLGRHDDALAVWREGQRREADNETLRETLRRLNVSP